MLRLPVLAYRYVFFLALIVIAYLAFAKLPDPPINVWDKLLHASAFCALLLLADQAYTDKYSLIHPLKIIGLIFYGLWIEAIQSFLPYREASALDLLANACGLSIYLALKFLYLRYKTHG